MKIAIVGYGAEGRSNYIYFRQKFPSAEMIIIDQKLIDDVPADALVRSSGEIFELSDVDLVVRSPGIAPGRIKTSGQIWSSTNEFFANCPAPIIGVTGTKGKGTTCGLIASLLRAAGKTVHLVGNIGVPALEILPKIKAEDFVVYELSSFQLWDIKKSPQVAVVVMIETDHLDVHANFDEYLEAKRNIRRYQLAQDACVYHPTNQYSKMVAETPLANEAGSQVGMVGRYAIPDDGLVYVKDGFFCDGEQRLCSIEHLQLVGGHNQENACAALSAIGQLSLKMDEAQYAEGLAGFSGLPHRLKYVTTKHGVKFYDDSIATTPGSAIAALKAFDQPKILIVGGRDKGANYDELAQEAAEQNMRLVITIGENAEKITDSFKKCAPNCPLQQLPGQTVEKAVVEAIKAAKSGDVVILSPAASSFDHYTNYAERGDKFTQAVMAIEG